MYKKGCLQFDLQAAFYTFKADTYRILRKIIA